MIKFLTATGVFVTFILFAFGIALLLAFPVMWVINYLFTTTVLLTLFGVTQISFWKAFWLNWICSILFKSSPQVKS